MQNKFTLPFIKRLIPQLKPESVLDHSRRLLYKLSAELGESAYADLPESVIKVQSIKQLDSSLGQASLKKTNIHPSRNKSMHYIIESPSKKAFDAKLKHATLNILHTKSLNKYLK